LRCPACLGPVGRDEQHCSDCGSSLQKTCPQCGLRLGVYGLLCPGCCADLRHLSDDEPIFESGFPLLSAFCHPLEGPRYRHLRDSSLSLALLRKVRKRMGESSPRVMESHSPDDMSRGFSEELGKLSLHFDCGVVRFGTVAALDEPLLSGTRAEPVIIVPEGLMRLLDGDEYRFIVLSTLFPLYCGVAALLAVLSEASDEPVSGLERWAEVLQHSADRFAVCLVPRPGAWLGACIKEGARVGDDIPSLLDALRETFPGEPSRIAARLKGSPKTVRRLLELAAFARGDVFSSLSGRNLLSSVRTNLTMSSEGGSSSAEPATLLSFPDRTEEPVSVLEPRRGRALLSGDLVYLSTYHLSLCVAGPDLEPFRVIRLEQWSRHPRRVAVDLERQRFIVTDFEASSILAIDFNGNLLFRISKSGRGQETLLHPTGVGIDSTGRIWVADCWNDRLQCFSSEGRWLRSISPSSTKLRRPAGLAYDPVRSGFWVADAGHGRIVKLGEDGSELFSFGQGDLDHPEMLCLDQLGRLVVCDTGNGLVKVWQVAGVLERVYGARSSDGAPLRYPHAVACGPNGELLVADKAATTCRLYGASKGVADIDAPLEDGHGCGFPCDLHIVPGLIATMGIRGVG